MLKRESLASIASCILGAHLKGDSPGDDWQAKEAISGVIMNSLLFTHNCYSKVCKR